ncbi:MAG: hypothetical protein ACKVUS_14935 [Saprospiraceae bacterium]
MSAILLSSDKPEDLRLLTELAERLGVHLFKIPGLPNEATIASVLRVPAWENESVAPREEQPAPSQAEQGEMPDAWHTAVHPIRQSQSIGDMEREQNYKGFDRAAFDKIVAELDIQDPNGELLQLLRA